MFGNFYSFTSPSSGWVSIPNSFVPLFIFYILSYLLLKTMSCLSGCLVSSASVQKLFCGFYSAYKCSFDEFVGEKVVFLSYSSAILGLPKFVYFYWRNISVQFSRSVVSDSLRPHESQHARPPCPSPTPELTDTHVYRVSDAIQPSHPLLSPSPPAPIPPSIRVFSNESILHMRWPKYWSFSFSIIPSKEIPGMISFRMD